MLRPHDRTSALSGFVLTHESRLVTAVVGGIAALPQQHAREVGVDLGGVRALSAGTPGWPDPLVRVPRGNESRHSFSGSCRGSLPTPEESSDVRMPLGVPVPHAPNGGLNSWNRPGSSLQVSRPVLREPDFRSPQTTVRRPS